MNAKKRPPVSSFKKMILSACLELNFTTGGYYRDDNSKVLYDDVTEELVYDMYTRLEEQRDIPRPSTFLREENVCWPPDKALNTSSDNVLTKIHTAFRDSTDYEGILEMPGVNYELCKHVCYSVSHAALRELVIKQREDGHGAKEDFGILNKKLRSAALNLDNRGYTNVATYKVLPDWYGGSAPAADGTDFHGQSRPHHYEAAGKSLPGLVSIALSAILTSNEAGEEAADEACLYQLGRLNVKFPACGPIPQPARHGLGGSRGSEGLTAAGRGRGGLRGRGTSRGGGRGNGQANLLQIGLSRGSRGGSSSGQFRRVQSEPMRGARPEIRCRILDQPREKMMHTLRAIKGDPTPTVLYEVPTELRP